MIELIRQEVFTTEGRLNRWRYFKYTLIINLMLGAFQVLIGILASTIGLDPQGILVTAMSTVISLPVFAGNLMVSIRRCHDLNLSGWYMLLAAVPGINIIFSLYILLAKGTIGYNRYGADPLM